MESQLTSGHTDLDKVFFITLYFKFADSSFNTDETIFRFFELSKLVIERLKSNCVKHKMGITEWQI